MENYILEACVDCVESAIAAREGGATRIELCSDLLIGGVSPSLPLFRQVRKYTDLKIRVLLRPRYGDYCYSEYECDEMEEEVKMFQEEGAEGVVVGALNTDGTLNVEELARLKEAAGPMEIALHRAFDVCRDPFTGLEEMIRLGYDTILTSGQEPTAFEGREMLKKLQEKSRGRIEILAAGGICREIIEKLVPYTGILSYHMSGKTEIDSALTYRKPGASMGLPERNEYRLIRTDSRKIRAAADYLSQAFYTPK